MRIRDAILCSAAGLAAMGGLCVLVPLMNRSSRDRPVQSPGRALRWMALAPKRAEAAPPERPRPNRPVPRPAPRPAAPRPSAGRAAPSAPRSDIPAQASPLRVDPWDLGLASPGQAPLFTPPVAEAAEESPPEKAPAPAEAKELYLSGEVDELPRPQRQVLPEYPARAMERGIEGFVLLQFVVDRDGKTRDIRVVDWRGSKDFCDPATEALSKWTFTPGRFGGKAVSVRLSQRFVFREED